MAVLLIQHFSTSTNEAVCLPSQPKEDIFVTTFGEDSYRPAHVRREPYAAAPSALRIITLDATCLVWGIACRYILIPYMFFGQFCFVIDLAYCHIFAADQANIFESLFSYGRQGDRSLSEVWGLVVLAEVQGSLRQYASVIAQIDHRGWIKITSKETA